MDMKKLFLGFTAGFVSLAANASVAPQCNSNELLIRRGHPYQYACVPTDSYALQVRCDSPAGQFEFVVPYISPGIEKNLVNGPAFDVLGSGRLSTDGANFFYSGKIQPSLEFANKNNFSISVAIFNDPQNRSLVLSLENGVASLEGVGQNITGCKVEQALYSSIQR